MKRLHDARLKCKIDKCYFVEPEMEYLGYIITKDGIKPNPKMVQAILDMQPPTNKYKARHFVGMVQYYRDLWPRRAEILLPLLTCELRENPRRVQSLMYCPILFFFPKFKVS